VVGELNPQLVRTFEIDSRYIARSEMLEKPMSRIVVAAALLSVFFGSAIAETTVAQGDFEAPLNSSGQPSGFYLGPVDGGAAGGNRWELTADGHGGAQALRIVRGELEPPFALTLLFPVIEAMDHPRRYLATCWVKPLRTAGRDGTPRLEYQAMTPEWTGACTLVSATEANPYLAGWSRQSALLELPSGVALGHFRYLVRVNRPEDGLLVDDVSLVEVTNTPESEIAQRLRPASEMAANPAGIFPKGTGNLLDNSSFELGMALGWSILALTPEEQRAAVDATTAWHGERSLRLDYSEDAPRVVTSKFRHVTPYRPYTLSAWVKSAEPGARVTLSFESGYVPTGYAPHHVETVANVSLDVWSRMEVTGITEPGPENGYAIRISAHGPGAGSVYVDGVQFEGGELTDYQPKGVIEASLHTTAPEAIFPWNEPYRMELHLQNYASDAVVWSHRQVTTDFWGNIVAVLNDEERDCPPGRSTVEFTQDPPARGSLRVSLFPSGQTDAVDELTLTIVPEPRYPARHPASRFGQHVQLDAWQLAVAKRLGAGWIRLHDVDQSLTWDHVEPTPGAWTWADKKNFSLAHAAGLEVLAVLGRTPAWAARDHLGNPAPQGGWICPTDLDGWERYVERVTAHYAGTVDHWEIWNEPYGFGIDDGAIYAELAKRAFQAAKRGNGACTVLGLCSWEGATDFNAAAVENGALEACDVASYHCYTGAGVDAYERGLRFRDAIGLEGTGIPVWMTEGLGGYTHSWHASLIDAIDDPYSRAPGGPNFTAEEAAIVGTISLVNTLANGAEKVFWYWSPWEGSGSIRPDRYTWFEYDGQLKPHAAAYAVCAYFLDGTAPAGRRISEGGRAIASEFRGEGRSVTVMWCEGGGAYTLSAREGCSVFDMMGNLISEGKESVSIGRHPMYIVCPES